MDVPRDFEWITGLGEPVALTRFPRSIIIGFLVGMGILVLVFGFLISSLLQGPLGLSNFATELLATLFFAIGFAGLGYAIGIFASRAAVLFERGIALRDGRQVRAWDYGELAGVAVKRIHRTTVNNLYGFKISQTEADEYNYRVYDRAGDSFLLHEWMVDVERVGEPVLDEVTNRVAPELVTMFEAGQTTTFGVIELSHEGIVVRGRRLTWAEVGDIGVENGEAVVINRDGRRTVVDLFEVTNAGVLFDIIGELHRPADVDEEDAPLEAEA